MDATDNLRAMAKAASTAADHYDPRILMRTIRGVLSEIDALTAERDALRDALVSGAHRIDDWATSALSNADAWGVCVSEIQAVARALLKRGGE